MPKPPLVEISFSRYLGTYGEGRHTEGDEGNEKEVRLHDPQQNESSSHQTLRVHQRHQRNERKGQENFHRLNNYLDSLSLKLGRVRRGIEGERRRGRGGLGR